MAYTVRFESNAFQADSAIARLVGVFDNIKRTTQRLVGVQAQEFQGDQLRELFGVNQRTLEVAMDWADNDFDEQIKAVKWRWKGANYETLRENGDTVKEPRDIVDMGDLLKSKIRQQVDRRTVEFRWDAPHAELVHDGGNIIKNQTVYYPARPWTEPTLAEIDTVISSVLARRGRK